MGNKKLGRTEVLHCYVKPEVKAFLKEQKPTANEYVNKALSEAMTRDAVVFKGTMSEVQKKIATLKKKYGAETPISEIVKRIAEGQND